MIILYACLLLVAVCAVVPGLHLRRLADVRLRHTWLVWLALAGQVVLISVLPDHGALSSAAHLASYGLAGVFAVVNLRVPGTWLVGGGGASNLSAIAANGGTMPASPEALEASGWQPTPGQFANSAAVAEPRLAFLGDVFATPSWLPVQSVFSVGDVVIVVGVAVFLAVTCRRAAPGPDVDTEAARLQPPPTAGPGPRRPPGRHDHRRGIAPRRT